LDLIFSAVPVPPPVVHPKPVARIFSDFFFQVIIKALRCLSDILLNITGFGDWKGARYIHHVLIFRGPASLEKKWRGV
jgi:hypothetical protein